MTNVSELSSSELSSSEAYLSRLYAVTDSASAKRVLDEVMHCDTSDFKNMFKPTIPFALTWDIFYKMVEVEDRFDLNHYDSAYVGIVLSKPKFEQIWNKPSVRNNYCGIEDFFQDLYITAANSIINKWDSSINDNFFAYFTPEMQTVFNRTSVSELSTYLRNTKGYSEVYIEGLKTPSKESGDEEATFEIADVNVDVESTVLDKIEEEEMANYNNLLNYNSDKYLDKNSVSNALVATQIFGGIGNFSPEMQASFVEKLEKKGVKATKKSKKSAKSNASSDLDDVKEAM